jgi:hypothetical protein
MTHTIENLDTKRDMSSLVELDCARITLHFVFIYVCLLLLSLHLPGKIYSLSLGSHSAQWKGKRKYCEDSGMIIDDMFLAQAARFCLRKNILIHSS